MDGVLKCSQNGKLFVSRVNAAQGKECRSPHELDTTIHPIDAVSLLPQPNWWFSMDPSQSAKPPGFYMSL